jgi:hypothetical protein
VNEIKNLDKVEFEPLHLTPDRETNDLRVDLIRQTHKERVNDSTRETEDTPYHPIGFDLGNGLYYDLNQNLSLRLDYLLDFSPDNDFEVHKITRPQKNSGIVIYRFNNDTLTTTYPSRKRAHYYHHQVENHDSVSYMYKKRLRYNIIETDTSLVYSGRRIKYDVIRKLDENKYLLDKRLWKVNYEIKGNDIFLGKNYSVSLRNNNTTIEIKRHWRKKNTVIYTIERSKDKIFIYDKHYRGKKIELDKNDIAVYSDKLLAVKYSLGKR